MAKILTWDGKGYFYLASPLTHPDAEVRYQRYLAAIDASADLIKKGIWHYSPIIHTFEMGNRHKVPYEFEYWMAYNEQMIIPSRGIIVLAIDGWDQSRGIQHELGFAKHIGREVWGYKPPSKLGGGYQLYELGVV